MHVVVQNDSVDPGAVAAETENRKMSTYSNLQSGTLFTPIAVESAGPIGPNDQQLYISGHRLMAETKVRQPSLHLLPAPTHFSGCPTREYVCNTYVMLCMRSFCFVYCSKNTSCGDNKHTCILRICTLISRGWRFQPLIPLHPTPSCPDLEQPNSVQIY